LLPGANSDSAVYSGWSDTLSVTRKLSAGRQLASAAVLSEFDTYEGYKALKEAVKVVNRAQIEDVHNFRILRRINLAHGAGKETWYGDSDGAERFSLIETFAAVAGAKVDTRSH
jgi:hypothetical protein